MCVNLDEVYNRFSIINNKLQIINNIVLKNKGVITIIVKGTEIKGSVNEIRSSSKFDMGEIVATISLYDSNFNLSTYNVLDIEKVF
jgi:hypothetical protein